MIIEPITYTKKQHSEMEAFFKRSGHPEKMPEEAKKFILNHIGLYTFIKSLEKKHVDAGEKMIKMCDQIKIHTPLSTDPEVPFQELIEKAEESSSPEADQVMKSLASLESSDSDPTLIQRFKQCWMEFFKQQLNEMIKEKRVSS